MERLQLVECDLFNTRAVSSGNADKMLKMMHDHKAEVERLRGQIDLVQNRAHNLEVKLVAAEAKLETFNKTAG